MRPKKVAIFLLINLKNPNQIKERQVKSFARRKFSPSLLSFHFLTHHPRLIADFSFRFSFLMN
jgi:hypothetical protein